MKALKFLTLVFLFLHLTGCIAVNPGDNSETHTGASTQPTVSPTPMTSQTIGQGFTGTWQNQRGSILVLEQEEGDSLKGTFTTAVAATKSCIGQPVPVRAVQNHNSLALSLSMETCGSPYTIAMSGLLALRKTDADPDKIDVMNLALKMGEESWRSRILVSDTYVRVSPNTRVKKYTPPQ